MVTNSPTNQGGDGNSSPGKSSEPENEGNFSKKNILDIAIAVLAVLTPIILSLLTSKISISIFIFLVIAGVVSVIVYLKKVATAHTLILIWLVVVILVLSLILFLPSLLSPRMAVTGVVTDTSGLPIVGEKIEIVDVFSTPHETVTDKEGKYRIDGVPKGFFWVIIKDIKLQEKPLEILGQEALMNFTFSVSTPAPIPTPTLSPTPTVFLISTSTAVAAVTISPTIQPSATSPAPIECSYQGKNDDETIKQLISAEAFASQEKNMEIIRSIFTEDAVFVDYAATPPMTWHGITERYQNDLFKNTDLKGVVHFDILPAGSGIAGESAWYTSGNQGFFKGTAGADWVYYFNPSTLEPKKTQFGSDHWTLKKINSCWVITRFDFNAGHVPFP